MCLASLTPKTKKRDLAAPLLFALNRPSRYGDAPVAGAVPVAAGGVAGAVSAGAVAAGGVAVAGACVPLAAGASAAGGVAV